MTWFELLKAFRNSREITVIEDSIITVNGNFKDREGYYVEMSSDSHTVCIELAGDYAKYSVNVKVTRDNKVTAKITIKGVGELLFPITKEGEDFTTRVNVTPCLSEFRQDENSLSELKHVFDWINKTCSNTIHF